MLIVAALGGCSQNKQNDIEKGKPPVLEVPSPGKEPEKETDPIAEQVKAMSIEDKLGQMLIVGLEGYEMGEDAKAMIDNSHIGGFILYGSNVKDSSQLIGLTNALKLANSSNKIPLFISVDEEGGRISRVPKEIKKLPTNKTIGKVNSEDFSYEIGGILAQEVKAYGFNMDYAPVLDINSNPKNPVIGDRAFGSKADVVSRLGEATMRGIQQGGAIPVVKHFPGHGDTSVDSHVGLPRVENDMERLNSFELIPFKNAIDKGADAVMVAHILLPKLDADNPATLSKKVITDILREQLGFKGVVITDDMTMGAIVKNYDIASAAVKSVEAGSDIVLVAHGYDNAQAVLKRLKEAVDGGVISEERLNESVYRILKLKQKYNLKDEEVKAPNINEINSRIDDALKSYMK